MVKLVTADVLPRRPFWILAECDSITPGAFQSSVVPLKMLAPFCELVQNISELIRKYQGFLDRAFRLRLRGGQASAGTAPELSNKSTTSGRLMILADDTAKFSCAEVTMHQTG